MEREKVDDVDDDELDQYLAGMTPSDSADIELVVGQLHRAAVRSVSAPAADTTSGFGVSAGTECYDPVLGRPPPSTPLVYDDDSAAAGIECIIFVSK